MKKQILYILTGLPYSGKTTLTKELVKRLGFEVISIDKIMEGYNMWRKGHPTQEDWNLAYSEAYKSLKQKLKDGKSIIWDSGCLKFSERETPRQIANELGVEHRLIYINTPIEEIVKRKMKNEETKERGQLTEKEMKTALNMFEKPRLEENIIIYNSQISVDDWIEKNIY